MFICSYCESQLEAALLLRKRLKFIQTFWTRYADNQKTIGASIDEIPLSCHLCNFTSNYVDLVCHMSYEHPDHEQNCGLCKVLLNKDL